MSKKRKVLFLLGMLLFAYVRPIHAHSIMEYSEPQGSVEFTATGEAFIYQRYSNRVSKVDVDGAIIWSNDYNSFGLINPSVKYPFNILLLRETGDGGCIAEGLTQEDPSQRFSRPQILLMKIRSDGSVEWLNRYENNIALYSYSFPWIQADDMIRTQDGGYLMAGTYVNDLFDHWSYLLKFDPLGNLEWQQKYYRKINSLTISGGGGEVVQVADGGYILYYRSAGMSGTPQYAVIVKIDATGMIQWQKQIRDTSLTNGSTSVANADILATNDHGCVVLAKDSVGRKAIFKFDTDTGEVVWEKGLGTAPYLNINHSADGGILVSSYSWNSPTDLDLFELDQNGDLIWGKRANSSLLRGINISAVQTGGHIKAASSESLNPLVIDLGPGETPNSCVTTTPISLPAQAYSLTVIDADFVASESAICGWYCSNNDLFSARALDEPHEIVASSVVAATLQCSSNEPPVADAGPDQALVCGGSAVTTAQLDGSLSFDPDGAPLAYFWSGAFGTSSAISPAVSLPFGRHQITLTVTDPEGETSTDSVAMEISDLVTPATTARVSATSGSNNWYTSDALVKLFATDNCSGSREIHTLLNGTETVTSGYTAEFMVSAEGKHFLQYWAVDYSGNIEQPQGMEIAIDKTAPVLALPAAMIAEAESLDGAVVAYNVAASDNLDPAPGVECTPPSQATFPFGTTTVNCTAVDLAGNSRQGSLTVTVADTTAPVVTPPAAVTVQYRGIKTAVNLGTATAFDTVGVASLVNDAPANFPKGVTTVTWTAVDTSGNIGTAVQTVTVATGHDDEGDDGGDDDDDDEDDNRGHDENDRDHADNDHHSEE